MDKTDFKGKVEKAGRFASCGENTFEDKAGTANFQFGNTASEAWHKGETYYNPTTGGIKTDLNSEDNRKAMLRFTLMVWKNTRKVGFGVRGKYVVAWYCDKQGNLGLSTDFQNNVGASCIVDRYNKCYADRALAA